MSDLKLTQFFNAEQLPTTLGNFHILKPRKALNKAFLKVKPNRSQIEQFKEHLIQLLDRSNETESEEFHKNLVTDFLKKTWYDPLSEMTFSGTNQNQ